MNQYKFIRSQESFIKTKKNTLGASDIPIIMGLSKFCTPYELWRQKTGRSEMQPGNSVMRWGNRHEVNILSSYIEETTDEDTAYRFMLDYVGHLKCRINYTPQTHFFPFTEFRHPELPFFVVHPDCINMQEKINIEAKSGRHFASIARSGFDGFDPDNPNGYPLKYYIQIQGQLLATGLNESVLRALIDTNTDLTYKITANKKFQEKIIELISRFWYLVKKDKPPMPVNSDDIKKIFPIVEEKTSYLLGVESEMAKNMVERKRFLNKKIKTYEEEVDDINDAIMLLARDNKYLYSEDNIKLCSQTRYIREYVKGATEIQKADMNLYLNLKDKNLIEEKEVRFIR